VIIRRKQLPYGVRAFQDTRQDKRRDAHEHWRVRRSGARERHCALLARPPITVERRRRAAPHQLIDPINGTPQGHLAFQRLPIV
ncbi:hypothetical protein J6590_104823, partial [Homalodisca vitripennis]